MTIEQIGDLYEKLRNSEMLMWGTICKDVENNREKLEKWCTAIAKVKSRKTRESIKIYKFICFLSKTKLWKLKNLKCLIYLIPIN